MVDSSGLDEKIDIYNPKYRVAFIVSIIIFILFFISQSLDFHKVLMEFGAGEVMRKGRFVYIYLAGYFIFIIKFLLAIFFIFILCAMIATVLILLIGLIKKKMPSAAEMGSFKGGAEVTENMKSDTYRRIEYTFRVIAAYIFGFVTLKQFMLVFLVCIPLFLFFYYLYYALIIYKPKIINEEQKDKMSPIMNTNHHFTFFLFVSMAVISILYLIYVYKYTVKNNIK